MTVRKLQLAAAAGEVRSVAHFIDFYNLEEAIMWNNIQEILRQ